MSSVVRYLRNETDALLCVKKYSRVFSGLKFSPGSDYPQSHLTIVWRFLIWKCNLVNGALFFFIFSWRDPLSGIKSQLFYSLYWPKVIKSFAQTVSKWITIKNYYLFIISRMCLWLLKSIRKVHRDSRLLNWNFSHKLSVHVRRKSRYENWRHLLSWLIVERHKSDYKKHCPFSAC